MALLDWEMPGLDGVEICRRMRERETAGNAYTYLLLLTSRGDQRDIVTGIEAGADDYVVKPFDRHELRARMRVGQRIVELQAQFAAQQQRAQQSVDALEAENRQKTEWALQLAAEVDLVRAKGVCEAVRTRKDMLVSLGAQVRAEMGGEPSVRQQHRLNRELHE